jgi:Cellulose synthase operon protein C C-terminus (BCSC_C)/Tetratricopeptide repeat
MSQCPPRLHAAALSLACLLTAGWNPPALADGAPPQLLSALLSEAQLWSDKNRTDIARQKIAKLLAMEPDSPEGLAFLVDMALRDDNSEEARAALATMQARLPQHPATQELLKTYRVYTQGREKLARMRLLVRAGRRADAANLARELFPDGAPRYGALGQEIARIMGQRGGPGTSVAQRPAPTRAAAAGPAPAAPTRHASVASAKPRNMVRTTAPDRGTASASATSIAVSQSVTLLPARSDGAPSEAELAAQRAQQLQTEANAQLQAERLSPALRLLEEALQYTPDDAWLRYDLARLYVRLQLPQQARSVADEGLQRRPADTDTRYAHALLLAALDEDAAALADLQQIAPSERSAGMQALEQRLQRTLRGQALDTQLQAARLQRSRGQYGDALALFQQAQHSALAMAQAGVPLDAQTHDRLARDIQAIEARRQAWVEVGQQSREKNSSEGLGSLRGWERPVVAWFPWGYQGTLFVHADQVQLDAGSYPGGEPFAQPGSEAITRGLPQRAEGLNVGLGYVGDDWRWDLGETGIGFAVRNWVGGLRYSGGSGAVGYSVELSRRPLSGTLLSYAGTYDPQTQAAWGGVVATDAGGRVATDIGPFSTSLSASVASLSGLNVADNSRLKWRLAADRDVYQDARQVLNLGLTLSGLHHDKDLSGYTWGHGGYYSPVRNITLSLPLEWSGRDGAFTWLVRASASLSGSTSSTTEFYPNNAALQQASGRVYGASGSTGSGWALGASAEYQATPDLALGARLEREVSDFYTPLNLLLYARYEWDPVRRPLERRPRPVQAYSQF